MNILILTGAGVSAESGIKTFRDHDGLWEGHRVEDVATPEAFAANPAMVQDFYNTRRRQLGTAQPNAAHQALAKLEEAFGDKFLLITQNVDDLHERAGNQRLIHMHGELLKKRCGICETISDCHEDIGVQDVCGECSKAGGMRPHIVWFGEIPFEMDLIETALREADLFIAIGTSGVVYPAAGFSQFAKKHGAKTLEVNLTQTELSGVFTSHLIGPASEMVPKLVEGLIAGKV